MQFLVLAGNRFWFYILLMYLGNRTIQLWCCVSFFGIFFVVAGKWFWREISHFFVVAGKFYYNRKKKFQSSVWRVRDQLRPEKKKIQAGNFHYERKKKKFQSSVWRVCQFLALTLTLIVFSVTYVLSNLY